MADFKPLMTNSLNNILYKEGRFYFEKDTGYLFIDKDNTRYLLYDTKASNKDIQKHNSISSFPTIGTEHRLYIDDETHTIYVWSNGQYINISSSNINTSNYYTRTEIDNKFNFGDYTDLLYTKVAKPATIVNATYNNTDTIVNVTNLLSSDLVAGLTSITPATININNMNSITTKITLELSRYYMWSDNDLRKKYVFTLNLTRNN